MINIKPQVKVIKPPNVAVTFFRRIAVAIKMKRERRVNLRKQRRFEQATKLLQEFGLVPCRLVTRAGTDYIISSDGLYHKVGRGEKK